MKATMLLLLAVALTMLAVSSGAQNAASLEEVKGLIRDRQYAEALPRLDEFLEVNPEDAEARFLKGLVLVEEGRSDEAVEVFRALGDDYPELPEPHNNLAVLYAAKGEYGLARESLLTAIRTHPSYATAHENLGDIYARMAGIAYGKALQIDLENETARIKLAMVRELFSARGSMGDSASGVVPAAVRESGTTTPTVAPQPKEDAPGGAVSTATTETVVAASVAQPRADTVDASDVDTTPSEEMALRKTIDQWARAWSAQDVDQYFSYYDPGFKPPGGAARDRWEFDRRERISAPRFIEIELSDVQVDVGEGGEGTEASVSFIQHYRSDRFRDSVRKTVAMSWNGSDWKIIRERVSR
jgi:tetratricopeptide (TPR) repeat protein